MPHAVMNRRALAQIKAAHAYFDPNRGPNDPVPLIPLTPWDTSGSIDWRLPAYDTTEPPRREVLKRMYDTGEWSDLSIVTTTKTFKVHKSVVCPASAFFHAACTRGFREQHTGCIEVEEDEHTMDIILRHFYDLPITWWPSLGFTFPLRERCRDWRTAILAVRRAADKYDIQPLALETQQVFRRYLDTGVFLRTIVELGAILFAEDMPVDEDMRSHLRHVLARRVEDIEDNETWNIIYENKEYTRFVFDAALSALQTARKRSLGLL